MDKNIIGISCIVFKDIIKLLLKENIIQINFLFIDSCLYTNPDKFYETIDKIVAKQLKNSKKILLLYGDCNFYMNKFNNSNISRVAGKNCYEIILGNELYKKYQKEGSYFLVHEWLNNWEYIFRNLYRLNNNTAKEFMQELYKKIIYIDTGINVIPCNEIQNFSIFSGLPYEIIKVDLHNIIKLIDLAIERLEYK